MRKCVKHVRKPLSKSLLQEIKATEGQKPETPAEADGENAEEKEKKEAHSKDKTEYRDWKRNGTLERVDSHRGVATDSRSRRAVAGMVGR